MLLNQNNPHGGDIYSHSVRLDFSANLNPYGMPPGIKKALEEAVGVSSVYPDPYCRRLQSDIARREGVTPSEVLCGNGAAELIYSFCYSLETNKPALVIEPTFSEYSDALQAAQIPICKYYLLQKDNFHLSADFLELELSDYSAVFLCAPNNPTGTAVESKMLCAVAKSGVRVLLDVSFLEFTLSPLRYELNALMRRFPNICVLRSMTKTYAMAGVRLGYAMCSDGIFLERMAQKTSCWNVSTLAQEAGIAALNEVVWLCNTTQRIEKAKEALSRELKQLGVRVFPGEANFLLLYHRAPLARMLLKKGIMVRDCANFDGLGEGFIRVAVRTPEENRLLVAAMKEVLYGE